MHTVPEYSTSVPAPVYMTNKEQQIHTRTRQRLCLPWGQLNASHLSGLETRQLPKGDFTWPQILEAALAEEY